MPLMRAGPTANAADGLRSGVDGVLVEPGDPAALGAALVSVLADPVRPGAAVAFYLLFVAGIVHFVVVPALQRQSTRRGFGSGAFFGLVTYATWDLTALSVIEGFPAAVVPLAMAWGTFLAAVVGGVTTWVLLRRTRT